MGNSMIAISTRCSISTSLVASWFDSRLSLRIVFEPGNRQRPTLLRLHRRFGFRMSGRNYLKQVRTGAWVGWRCFRRFHPELQASIKGLFRPVRIYRYRLTAPRSWSYQFGWPSLQVRSYGLDNWFCCTFWPTQPRSLYCRTCLSGNGRH